MLRVLMRGGKSALYVSMICLTKSALLPIRKSFLEDLPSVLASVPKVISNFRAKQTGKKRRGRKEFPSPEEKKNELDRVSNRLERSKGSVSFGEKVEVETEVIVDELQELVPSRNGSCVGDPEGQVLPQHQSHSLFFSFFFFFFFAQRSKQATDRTRKTKKWPRKRKIFFCFAFESKERQTPNAQAPLQQQQDKRPPRRRRKRNSQQRKRSGRANNKKTTCLLRL